MLSRRIVGDHVGFAVAPHLPIFTHGEFGQIGAFLPDLARCGDHLIRDFSRGDQSRLAIKLPGGAIFAELRRSGREAAHSTALHARHVGHGPYLVGPLARINTSFERLGRAARDAAAAIGFEPPCHNPFKSILARGIELIQVLDEAQRIIENHPPVGPAFTPYEPRAGVGHGATEAPRGLLYHRYRLAEDGTIAEATIVPPTSQNQATIEDDLRHLAPSLAAMPLEDATQRAEQAVRNYDPCISCSTHFLKLRIEGA